MLKLTSETITTEMIAMIMVADATFHREQSTAGREGSSSRVRNGAAMEWRGAHGAEWGERWSGMGRAMERREELTRGHGKAVGEGERTNAAELRARWSVIASPMERNCEPDGAEKAERNGMPPRFPAAAALSPCSPTLTDI